MSFTWPLGPSLGSLGTLLAASWGLLGPLEPSWGALGAFFGKFCNLRGKIWLTSGAMFSTREYDIISGMAACMLSLVQESTRLLTVHWQTRASVCQKFNCNWEVFFWGGGGGSLSVWGEALPTSLPPQ